MIDRILLNARIYTQNPSQPWASALAISHERIVAVGDDEAIRVLAGPATQIDNGNGRLVIPGLTDAHLHFRSYARTLKAVNLVDVPSKAEALERVAQRIATTPPGEWIYGIGWRKGLWEDRAFPTAVDLDTVSPNHPVYLTERSGHAAWVNTLALQKADITRQTPDPEGGHIQRLSDGQPSGVLLEDPAMDLVKAVRPKTPPHVLADWIQDAQDLALQMGLTGFHDYDKSDCLDAFQLVRERGALRVRLLKHINDPFIEHAYELGIRSGFGDDWIRIGNLKIFADGALGPQTARMIDPYESDPTNYGITVTDKEEIYTLVSKASTRGFAATIHAIGDKANHDVLDVYEAVRREEAERGIPRRNRRHRLEHVQVIHPSDVGRLAALGVIASMQPIHATSDYELVDHHWGQRGEYAYAFRKQLVAGAVLAFGSDAPLDNINPIAGIHAAITRQRADGSPEADGWYSDERLTLEQTLQAFTQGPAYAAYMEDRLGMLAPGYLADLVMLDRDWFAIPSAEILETTVVGTMVGGEWRYRDFD